MRSILDDSALTHDAFLGGALRIWQPKQGYRAGIDPVLLAAAVPAQQGESVLELGCGVGVAACCLAHRTKATVTGLEVQSDYAALARRNADDNGLAFTVIEGDLQNLPTDLRNQSFDHVMANPPYFRAGRGTLAQDAGKETSLGEATELNAWLDVATRRLKPRGRLCFIQKADRLQDMLAACSDRLGEILLLPIASRTGRAAELIILRARKGAKGPLKVLAPLVLHDGACHLRDEESYRPEIGAILRDGQDLADAFSVHR